MYYGLTQFMSVMMILLLEEDCAYLTSFELSLKNLVFTIPITILLATSRPYSRLTRHVNPLKLMTVRYQITFWSIAGLVALGLTSCGIYYYNSDDFVPNNEHRYAHAGEGWFGDTKSSTVAFIASSFFYVFLTVIIYKGSPWKQPFWKAKALRAYVVFLLVLTIALSLLTEHL